MTLGTQRLGISAGRLPFPARGSASWPRSAASGRVLIDTGERDRAAAAMRAQWGPGRRLFEFFSRPLTDVH
jgi:hypothetical protein